MISRDFRFLNVMTQGYPSRTSAGACFDQIFPIVIFSISALGCNPERVSKHQQELHTQVHQFYESAFNEFQNEIGNSAQEIERCVNSKKECFSPSSNADELSSVYVPEFSKKSAAVSAFKSVSRTLETHWEDFLKRHPYVSWLYILDATTGSLRISPATPTELTFGKSIDFRTFEFFASAQQDYPRVSWQKKTKEDISGTGLILMASKAVKKSHNEISHVISGDLKVSSIAKSVQPLFDEFVSKTRAKGFHFFAYLKPDNHFRSPISEYASDQAEWLSLRSFSNNDSEFLHVTPMAQAKLLSIEEKARALSARILKQTVPGPMYVTGRVQLGQHPYHCSVSQLPNPQVILWICVR